MTYIASSPQDAGADHECERKLVTLEQPPRNRAIYGLRALLEKQVEPCG